MVIPKYTAGWGQSPRVGDSPPYSVTKPPNRIAIAMPTVPTTRAPANPTANGFNPTPRNTRKLVLSPTAGLVRSSGSVDLGSVTVPDPPGPIVVVVLDELPVTTLMRADGSINADRFPGFARLAERSTWFRNASVHHTSTHLAVPALLVA